MRIIEQFTRAKTGRQEDNEDWISISPDFMAVIDGSTAKTAIRYNESPPGRRAAELVHIALQGLPAGANAYQATDAITNRLAQEYRRLGIEDKLAEHPEERMAASVTVFSRYYRQVWAVGDTPFMLDGQVHDLRKKEEEEAAAMRAAELEKQLEKRAPFERLRAEDPGRAGIIPWLLKYLQYQNKNVQPYGYGVIDGFHVPREFIQVTEVQEAKEIALASDGYPFLMESLMASEKLLHEILREDPLLFRRYKATKGLKPGNESFDDRSYLRFRL